jgi:hypothetical protein
MVYATPVFRNALRTVPLKSLAELYRTDGTLSINTLTATLGWVQEDIGRHSL